MAFSGDLASLSLADLFQNISLNQQTGTLVVQQARKQKAVYFKNGMVAFASSTESKDLLIGELLLRAKEIAPDDLEAGLRHPKNTGDLLGKVLIDMGFVTEKSIRNALSHQIEEEVYDLFVWHEGTFEFMDGPPSGGYFDLKQIDEGISLPTSNLIMEAARRADEWELIFQVIVSEHQIFFRTEQGNQSVNNYPPDESSGIVLALVDGSRNVEDLARAAYLSKFEIGKVLSGFIQNGQIRPLTVAELKRLAKGLRGLKQLEKSIHVYEWVLENAPEDIEAHALLADTLEEAEYPERSAEAYIKMGIQQRESGRIENAVLAFEKAALLNKKLAEAHEHLMDICCEQGRTVEVVERARALVDLYKSKEHLKKRRIVCQRVLDLIPDNMDFRELLAAVCIDMGDEKEAIAEYETLAEAYLVLNDKDRVEAAYKQILILSPRRKDIRRKLKDLHIDYRVVRRQRIRLAKRLAMVAVVIAIAGVFVYMEMRARESLEDVVVRAKQVEDSGDLLGAAKFYEEFADSHKYYLVTSKAKDMAVMLHQMHDRKVAQHEAYLAERAAHIAGEGEAARKAWEDGDPHKALKQTQVLLAGLSKEETALEPVEDVRELEASIEEYIQSSSALAEKAHRAEKAGNMDEASKLYQDLLKVYPNCKLGREASVPLRVVTVPTGARVSLNGQFLGTSPVVGRWRPGAKIQITVEKKSYKRQLLEMDSDKGTVAGSVMLTLKKGWKWRFETQGPVQSKIIPHGNQLYFGGRDGKMYCIRANDGSRIWSQSTGSLGDIQADALVQGDKVLFGAYDGMVYALGLKNGQMVWQYDTNHMIKCAIVRFSDYFMVVANNLGHVFLLRLLDGEPRWRFKVMDNGRIEGPPAVSGHDIYVGTDQGALYAINGEGKGKLKWKFQTNGPIHGAPLVYAGRVYVGSEDGNLYAVDSEKGNGVWTFPTGGAVRGKPAVYQDMLIVTSDSGKVYAINRNKPDESAWVFEGGGGFQAGALVYGDKVYVTCRDGKMYALSAKDGALEWMFAADGPILSSAIMHNGLLIVASDDKSIYAVEP